MQRQAATPIGFLRRIRDLQFERIRESRCADKVKHKLKSLMTALVAGVVTRARSLRAVEQRTDQIGRKLGDCEGIKGRIADNTFGKLLRRLRVGDVLKRLHVLIKAEHRRGNLGPTVLPFSAGAIDGKNVATLRWHDLCRVLDLDPKKASNAKVKKRLAKEYPNVQFCVPENGRPYALARVHTVTLISSLAAPCIHQRPIPGHTNEIGAMPDLLKEIHAVYGCTRLLDLITTDAGNTALKVNGQIVNDLRLGYFSQIKCEHGEIYKEAERALGTRKNEKADFSYTDTQNGDVVTYHVWHYDLTDQGWLDWTHARQLVRVQRRAVNATNDKESLGNRYYVSSRTPDELAPTVAVAISRAHWRCEEETHWTADAMLQEDLCRLSWSRDPNGVFVASAVRMIGLAILAIARKLSRLAYSKETPTWRQVAEHFFLALCASTLLTDKFDAPSA
jgi:predicted transposase YbfD/YdcC